MRQGAVAAEVAQALGVVGVEDHPDRFRHGIPAHGRPPRPDRRGGGRGTSQLPGDERRMTSR
ncbi:hypothetical protein [Ornithinimicrobium kibberense]|uniref:hypothetical protein n=1 Tax=Ornithinimicrobium kibberense TaxID=282060 RepID=UPI0036117E40